MPPRRPFGPFVAAVAFAIAGCGTTADPATGATPPGDGAERSAEDRPTSCPSTARAPARLPGVRPEMESLAYWVERSRAYGDPDAELLGAAAIHDQNRALTEEGEDPPGQFDLLGPVDPARLAQHVEERLTFLRESIAARRYVDAEGRAVEGEVRAAIDAPAPDVARAPELRVAVEDLSLHCGPTKASFYTPALDLAFDRNRCSTVRAQEVVQVLGRWPNGTVLARAGYALGWIDAGAPLSPPLSPALAEAFVHSPRVRASVAVEAEGARAPAGALLAPSPEAPGGVLLAHRRGFAAVSPGAALASTARPLTRRAVLEEAFALLGAPYGWGGIDGGRDCSRFLLDIFATFGIALPRNSSRQALAGTFSIDVSHLESAAEKGLVIEAAAHKGIVLLHFPGHIMLYLGRTEEGVPMVMHSFSEYLRPCETPGSHPPLETLLRVDRVAVSDLSLGAGSSRRSFLERIEKVIVLGPSPGLELQGAATLRPAAKVAAPAESACHDGLDASIFRSPNRPHPGQPLRVIATTSEHPGPVRLTLFDPEGTAHTPPPHPLGGPPYTYWAELAAPTPGEWTAVLGDGARVVACERFTVARFAPTDVARAPAAPAWTPAWRWERDTEHLYAAFVEQLFRDPVDGDVTWSSLTEVLRDPARNLLHDHKLPGEDERLDLEPDCADLPYFLRAYFAWKLRLPFGFRPCSRGRAGAPPACPSAPITNLEPVDATTDLEAFVQFSRRVARGVHSASARTAPRDDATDVYPLPLDRAALVPGTVFADPYGHLLVVAAWLPQGTDRYGVLVGADAQPDGTVGRRRFWRGTFLFDPDTTDVGAGFKAFRPLVYDARARSLTALDNATLARSSAHRRYSEDQYRGSADDFYDRMEELINPRPLEPMALLLSLVDALEESAVRRVLSVDNGERYAREHDGRPVEMPEGYAIFETEGPWEDFATPSRDMRLLISIDAVVGFPDAVVRSPERFGRTRERAEAEATRLRERLASELGARRFRYVRSDGGEQELTLADLIERKTALEMAYNPNDCVELRWGAPEGSAEHAHCARRAPAAQRARMAAYRPWFHDRKRPPR